jgi:hypothetical protein
MDDMQLSYSNDTTERMNLITADLKEWRSTSAIIIWQSKVPLPIGLSGRCTRVRIFVTTGAPKVMFGTKCPFKLVNAMAHDWDKGVYHP